MKFHLEWIELFPVRLTCYSLPEPVWCCRDKLDLFALPLSKNKIKFLSWHQRLLALDFKKFKGFYGLTFCGVLLSPLRSEIEEKKILNCEKMSKKMSIRKRWWTFIVLTPPRSTGGWGFKVWGRAETHAFSRSPSQLTCCLWKVCNTKWAYTMSKERTGRRCIICKCFPIYVRRQWRLSPVWAMLWLRLTFWKVKMEDPATLDKPSSSSVNPRENWSF